MDGEPTSPSQSRTGTLVAKRYRLEQLAGTGATATVWRATDLELQRDVAVKLLRASQLGDQLARRRLMREARIQGAVRHPNVVGLHACHSCQARPCIVMEYVPGTTLSALIGGQPLGPPVLDTIAAELLEAVGCIHDHGFLHGDIKPANVLIDRCGEVHLTDFGAACHSERQTAHLHGRRGMHRRPTIAGTPRYLAPERFAGGPASRQSDLFALGMLLRAAADPGLDGRLTGLIAWLTADDPTDRPPDAAAALTALRGRAEHSPPGLRLRRAGAAQDRARARSLRAGGWG